MNKEEKINWVADKILIGMGNEKDLRAIASKQKKSMNNFSEIHKLAREQIIKELKANPERLEVEDEFFKEVKD